MRNYLTIIAMLAFLALPGCKAVRLLSLFKSTKQHIEPAPLMHAVEVPFSYEQGWMVLRVTVCQDTMRFTGNFLFDTGAATRLFDSCRGIKMLTPQGVSRLPVTGTLGTSWKQLRIAKKVSLQIGSFAVLKPSLFVSDHPPLFPGHWLGIIGADFFHRHILTIDFKRQTLLISPRGSFAHVGLPALKMKTIANYNPVLAQVQLGDLRRRDYLIDAGNNGSVLIQQPDEVALRQAMGRDVRVYAFSQNGPYDASGKAVASHYFVKTLAEVNDMPCPEYEVAGLVNDVSHRKYGNMGLAFLNKVFESVTLDFGRGALYYRINTQPGQSAICDREVYFSQEGDSFFTGPVMMNSTWYQQGLRPRMPVSRINEHSPSVYMADRKSGRSATIQSITIVSADTIKILTRKK